MNKNSLTLLCNRIQILLPYHLVDAKTLHKTRPARKRRLITIQITDQILYLVFSPEKKEPNFQIYKNGDFTFFSVMKFIKHTIGKRAADT